MLNEQALQIYHGLFYNSLGMDDQYPGGESPRENYERIKVAFEKLSSAVLSGQPASEVGVVTHGGGIHKLEYINQRWMFTI